jgi:hypothetical protein
LQLSLRAVVARRVSFFFFAAAIVCSSHNCFSSANWHMPCEWGRMKRTIIISIASAALVLGALNTYADHEKDCKDGKHGRVTAKTDSSITVGGTTYNTASATVSREDGQTASASSVKVGDKVCVMTASADSKDASKVMILSGDAKGSPSSSSGTEKGYATLSDAERKAHDENCKGHHGVITDKTANSITIDGTTYALKINTPVNKQEEALLTKTSKVGDHVCFDTAKAADGSQQITKLMAIDEQSDRTRVRSSDSDTDVKVKDSGKVEVETPEKKIEVK